MAYHFVVNLVEMDFTDFIDYIFAFKGDESEASVSVGLLIKHEHGVFNLWKEDGIVFTVITKYQKSFILASEASYVYFQKTFGESSLPLVNSFKFFQIMDIYSLK